MFVRPLLKHVIIKHFGSPVKNALIGHVLNVPKLVYLKTTFAIKKIESISAQISSTSTKEASFLVGESLAKKAGEKQINLVVFDRGNRPYHGRIASLAEGARKQGLNF